MFTGAFIFVSNCANPQEHNTKLHYGKERLLIIGVPSVEEGIAVAKRVVEEEGCRIIELCGGFGEEGARAVKEATAGKALVGYTLYFPEDAKMLEELVEELTQLYK